jgi:anti-sigma factor RsiW
MSHLGALISALLDGELTPVEGAEADAHLLSCPECRAELAATRRARQLLRELPMLDWVHPVATRRSRRPVAALAAVAAVAIVGVVAWPPAHSATPPLTQFVNARTVSAVTAGSVATIPPAAVNPPFQAPASLPGGYQRVGMYRQHGDLGAMYSNGTASLVVFEQSAHLDRDAMPPGGQLVSLKGWVGVSYAWDGGQSVTWERGGTTYTVMGDGPAADVVAVAGSMPGPRSLSTMQRARRACRGVVEALSGLW